MSLGSLIETHGYWVLALGCLLEGETVLVLAGFAAHRGYLNPFAVVGIATVAGFLGDQAYFWLGRRHGPWVMARWPRLARQAARVQTLLTRFQNAAIVGIRFAYGLRIAGPIVFGTLDIPASKFALFNALGALIWAVAIGALGWVFGQAAEMALGELRHVEAWLLLALAAAGAMIGLWRWFAARNR